MSDTPGPLATSPSMRKGRFATVPSSKTVSMWPISRMRGPAPGSPSNVPMTVSPSRPAGSGRRSTVAPMDSRSATTHDATSLTPFGV